MAEVPAFLQQDPLSRCPFLCLLSFLGRCWWWWGDRDQGALITHQTCWHVISDGQPPHLLFISHLPGCSVAWQSLSLLGLWCPCRGHRRRREGRVVQHHPRLAAGEGMLVPVGRGWDGLPLSLIPRLWVQLSSLGATCCLTPGRSLQSLALSPPDSSCVI